ncbi:MAG: CDP-alcohol phosphatidyltransferase family protein [Planctomycetota bacterium]|jgi:phosphatidylglycerophosphate synthase
MPLRPLVMDELPDRILARPLGRALARLLVRTPVRANHVSGFAALCGIAAGVALAREEGVVFAAVIVAFLVLDCADGELARLRGGGGVWGRIMDGAADSLTSIAVHVGLMVWLHREIGVGPAIAWGVGAGLSLLWTAFLLDKVKRRYRGDADDPDALRRERDRETGLKRFILLWFLPYARSIAAGPAIPDREAYRVRVRPLVPFWFFIGPTTHFAVWAVLAAFDRPLLYAMVACLPFNVVALVLLVWQYVQVRKAPAVIRVAA